MDKKYQIGGTELIHYYMPGKFLDDISLKYLHNSLVRINEESGANVVNKMLERTLTLEEIRTHLKNTVIAIGSIEQAPCGFLISPLLSSLKGKPIVHSGLVVISKNPGVDFATLMGFGNLCLAYEKLGPVYATNITSTPSIVESFMEMVPGSWPSPDVSVKVAPKGYREVVKVLKEEYMDLYFSDPGKIDINYKRFILTSNSQEMGFTTDFHKISRSNDFKYMLFCHAWVNYEKEEDIIQVGEVNLYKYLRMQILAFMVRRALMKAEAVKASEQGQSIKTYNEKKKVA
jgi:hypothetical protein